jgi:hypothetical protein
MLATQWQYKSTDPSVISNECFESIERLMTLLPQREYAAILRTAKKLGEQLRVVTPKKTVRQRFNSFGTKVRTLFTTRKKSKSQEPNASPKKTLRQRFNSFRNKVRTLFTRKKKLGEQPALGVAAPYAYNAMLEISLPNVSRNTNNLLHHINESIKKGPYGIKQDTAYLKVLRNRVFKEPSGVNDMRALVRFLHDQGMYTTDLKFLTRRPKAIAVAAPATQMPIVGGPTREFAPHIRVIRNSFYERFDDKFEKPELTADEQKQIKHFIHLLHGPDREEFVQDLVAQYGPKAYFLLNRVNRTIRTLRNRMQTTKKGGRRTQRRLRHRKSKGARAHRRR